MPALGLVAGEASGDYLAGRLLGELRRAGPGWQAEGIGGRHFQAAGGRSLEPMERLAVMGLMEVLGRYGELHRLRARLIDHFLRNRPAVFVGVDAPDFNLGVERALRAAGVRTVHLVSPSVWAWRGYRVHRIARAVDHMLVLFPFEEAIYRRAGIPVTCIGHPLADDIPLEPDRDAARDRLGLGRGETLVAIMPGSRAAELDRLLEPFLQAAAWLHARRPGVRFISSLLHGDALARLHAVREGLALSSLPLTVFEDRAHDVLEAADVALLASGTITLEAMLFKKPMVVAYRMHPLTFGILRRMVRVPFASLPNLLAGEELVPELLQGACRAERLGQALLDWILDPGRAESLRARFAGLHASLRRGAAAGAAAVVMELAARP